MKHRGCCGPLYPVVNQRAPFRHRIGPNALDPSRTGGIRRAFIREISLRFERLKAQVIKLLNDEDALGKREEQHNPFLVNSKYEYCSTQFNIEEPYVLERLKYLQGLINPADVLKMEDTPHITVRYGLHEQTDLPKKATPLVVDGGQVRARVGTLSLFSLPQKDVLVYSVDGQQLHDLNRRLALLPNTQTFPTYTPHITVAYLKPGTGAKYLGIPILLKGVVLQFKELNVSTAEGEFTPITLNTRWKFSSDPEVLKAFKEWLRSQVKEWVIGRDEEELWRMYAQQGFQKGAARAFDDFKKAPPEPGPSSEGKDSEERSVSDFYKGTREQFLRQAFHHPVAVDKIKLLSGRSFTDLQGVTEAMSTAMVRTLTDGLVKGASPREIARDLNKDVDGIGKQRALTIARTEIIRAHAEGQLEALRQLGEEYVTAMVEWSTAGDERVCPMCKPLQGVVLKLEEARGMLPRHPNCRCAWIPAGVGEDTTGQKTKAPQIRRAIAKSKKAGTPLKKLEGGSWGAGSPITTKRPTS